MPILFETMEPSACMKRSPKQEQQDEQRYKISSWSKDDMQANRQRDKIRTQKNRQICWLLQRFIVLPNIGLV